MNIEKELREAIEAADQAIYSTNKALDYLYSAKRWGVYDILGGGAFSSWIKHGKVDKADKYVSRLNRDLEIFKDELSDLNMQAMDYENIGFTLSLLDIAFDNIVFDWTTQRKIKKNIKRLEKLRHDLNFVAGKLKKEYEQIR